MSLGKTLAEIEAMPAAEFALWREFYEVEPFGPAVEAYGHATTACLLYNAHRGERAQPRGVSDFLPTIRRPVRSAEELYDKFRLAVGMAPKYGARKR